MWKPYRIFTTFVVCPTLRLIFLLGFGPHLRKPAYLERTWVCNEAKPASRIENHVLASKKFLQGLSICPGRVPLTTSRGNFRAALRLVIHRRTLRRPDVLQTRELRSRSVNRRSVAIAYSVLLQPACVLFISRAVGDVRISNEADFHSLQKPCCARVRYATQVADWCHRSRALPFDNACTFLWSVTRSHHERLYNPAERKSGIQAAKVQVSKGGPDLMPLLTFICSYWFERGQGTASHTWYMYIL